MGLNFNCKAERKPMKAKKEIVMSTYEGFKAKEGEPLFDYYTRLNGFVNDLRRIGVQKTNYEVNVKFLKNLTRAWEQSAVHLQMTHNLRSQGLHDLYRTMVQHEDIITGKTKKTDVVALISKQGENTPSKGKIQRKDASSGDDADFVANSSESDEGIRMLNEDTALMAKDIRKMKAAKNHGRFGSSEKRYDDRYKPRERFDNGYRGRERYGDRYQLREKFGRSYRREDNF